MKEPSDREAVAKMYRAFGIRVLRALKPATKMWQDEHKEPLRWPDPITLIRWLTRKAKGRHNG